MAIRCVNECVPNVRNSWHALRDRDGKPFVTVAALLPFHFSRRIVITVCTPSSRKRRSARIVPICSNKRPTGEVGSTPEHWISERVLKLSCTAEDMIPLAQACGFKGSRGD